MVLPIASYLHGRKAKARLGSTPPLEALFMRGSRCGAAARNQRSIILYYEELRVLYSESSCYSISADTSSLSSCGAVLYLERTSSVKISIIHYAHYHTGGLELERQYVWDTSVRTISNVPVAQV